MQRPMMNAAFLEEEAPKKPSRPSPLGAIRRLGSLFMRVLFSRPLSLRRETMLRIEVGSPVSRFIWGLMYRLVFVPVLVAMVVVTLVYAATHPPQVPSSLDPTSANLYFEPLTFLSEDGKRLEAWLIPVLDARRIIAEGDQALRRQHPAVLLVHDYGASREQMLPMIKPLHEAGIVVMAVSLRGSGSSGPGAHTFGIKESLDVRVAVQMLRTRAYVDPERIAVLGIGTGASAALLAADRDAQIAALVLQDPVERFSDVLEHRLGPRQRWLNWMDPLCRMAFEIGYQANPQELRLEGQARTLSSRPVLLMQDEPVTGNLLHPEGWGRAEQFLHRHLLESAGAVAGAEH
jgi:pimeloyl-ACP methyl ester carboxylesterase